MAALEREANQFAAELLMPEHLVRQAALEEGADARRLADRFDVSIQAMHLRLRRLGLVSRQSDLPPTRDVV
jgi:Zn-dependent peptidase ImmA (M78 family)